VLLLLLLSQVHMLMFALWSEQTHQRNSIITLQRWPLPPPPRTQPAAAATHPQQQQQHRQGPGTAAAAAVTGQQQQQQQRQQQQAARELLCDVDQLMLLQEGNLLENSCK
jgi:hypothetical protein